MDPMGTMDSIYKEEYYTLICSKYESYGPCRLENFFFFQSNAIIPPPQ